MSEEFIFKAKTREAFVLKILGELINFVLKFASFKINEKGIFLLQPCDKNHQMIEISLFKEYFPYYRCDVPISFEVNCAHLHKMLKAIKKKDGITLFINNDNDDDLKLGICVEQSDENNKVVTYIPINKTRSEDIKVPTDYDSPIIMTNKEFQKLKNLHTISEDLVVTSKPEFIKFFCDGGSIYSRELVIGNENDEDNKHINITYRQTFYTPYITRLTKCAMQSGVVQIFVDENNGMKIKMKAGGLGEVIVYIKSKEIIEDEDEDQNLVIIGKETSTLSLNESSQRKEIIVETDFDEYNNSSSRKVMNRDYSDDESEESESELGPGPEEIKKSSGPRSSKKIKNRK
jgi:proliferating cell nuclear antigen PCNA